MGGSFGPDARLGAPATEGLFREQLLSALAQWHQRLARPNAPAAEAGAIAQEAAQLRAVAQSRGWATVQHLLYLENIALNAPRGLLQAIAAIANALRAAPPAGPAQHTVVLPQAAAVRAAGRSSAPPPGPPQPGSPLPAPPQQAPAGQPSLVLPPSHAALAPPSLIEASPRAASAPPPRHPDSTLYSAQTPGRPAGAPAAADQGPVGAPSPLPPDSLPKQRPPSLLARSILGLRAFRGKAGGPEQAAGAPYDPPIVDKPLFGFRPLSSQPAPPPAGRLSSRPPAEPKPSKARRSSRPRSRPSARSEAPVPRWYYLLIALAGLLGAATVVTVVVLGRRAKQPLESNRAVAPTKSGAPAAAAAAPQAPGTDPSASQIEQIATAVHKGGTETPELRALLDLQGKLATSCRDDPTMCGRGWTPLAREALTPVDVKDFTPSSGDAPLAAWLKRLKLPRELGVRDEPALRSSFDFNTKNIAGRQALQAKLFECSAYADIFDSTFIKYGAPGWLTAVVYQESACNPRATSSVGAKGLWQFMPESARIYGLRVVEGDVDERLNPVKSTDAAVHFLTDLQRKLGAWDLTLAAYNMGPFAILARLAQVGHGAGFWDLVHAHVLPEETAGYVPAIESFALVLENVSRLQFSRDGKRLESTAEVMVKPGTRLSLIARAAATTTVHIRELNPEFLRDVVPEGETTARVPDAEAHRAQTFLDAWAPDDNRDTCVPEDFDWGAKQFERSSYAKTCAQAGPPR